MDVLLEHVYLDEAVSGAGSDRPGLNRLLDVAFAKGKRTFDVILVDDTSRLSRSLADSVRITERLKFEGIRLVAVSQGIDSHDEQSDVMMAVHSEIYVGRVIWNKSKWIKRPGTNKCVRRPRSESEWKIIDRPDLRIITEECWAAVQQKIAYTMEKYSNGARKGLANRIQTSPYLLSGFLKCNDCGAHLVIVSGRGGKWARYGCTQHWNRGACKQ